MKTRIHTIDEIRGFAIICMVIFHALYTMSYLFHVSFANTLLLFFNNFQPFFAAAFIIISGISSQLSRGNLKRGVLLLLLSLGVTLVSLFFPKNEIYFGILHFLSISILLFALIKKPINKINTSTGLITSALMFFITYGTAQRVLGIPKILSFSLPYSLYQNNCFFALGFINSDFHSSDYFPMLPWFFAFLFGIFLGKYAKNGQFPECMYKPRVRILSSAGKHTLIIYLVHQPVIFFLCYLCDILINQ